MKLKAYRDLRKLTQAEVADQLGTDKANICRWEDGTIPRQEMVRKIRNWSGGAVMAAVVLGLRAQFGDSRPALAATGLAALAAYALCVLPSRHLLRGTALSEPLTR